jgi:hypothetical protein
LIARIHSLKKIRVMLDYSERSQKMREITALSGLMDRYGVECHRLQGEVAGIVANIKAIVRFESQRVALIQEVKGQIMEEGGKEVKGYL